MKKEVFNSKSRINLRQPSKLLSNSIVMYIEEDETPFIIDNDDYDLVKDYIWMTTSKGGYIRGYKRGMCYKYVFLHRLIMNVLDSKDIVIDHINRNPLDNRKSNLRKCTKSQNKKNRTSSGKSKYLGVSVINTKQGIFYTAQISIDKKQTYLGRFKNEKEAALCYDNAAIIYHKEFANLNFKVVERGVRNG